jgi:hypothetical protein
MLVFALAACSPEEAELPSPAASSSETADSAAPPVYPADAIAFVGVDVLTMLADEPALVDRTVVVHDGRILDVASAEVPLPDTVTVIDGAGRTLMPGLIDAHVHVWYEGELTLLLANGVTSARNLFGDPLQRGWRDEIEAGRRLGPRLVVSGPIVDGIPPLWPTSDLVATPEDADPVVQAQVEDGYDLIKVYNRLRGDVYQAILESASARGIPVAGHVPWQVGWDAVVDGSQVTIEHFDGLIDRVGGTGRSTFLYDVAGMTEAMDARDDEALRQAGERVAADGVFVVPTLVVIDGFQSPEDAAADRADPLMQYVHPDVAWSWATTPPLDEATVAMLDRYALEVLDYTAAFHDAGARVVLGTDANNAYVLPGFSVHRELELLVRAGLTPGEALIAGTATAAAAIGLDDVGTIEVGKRADLLLLGADPREDVAHAADRVGVMVAGQWHEEAELQALMDELAASYAAQRAGGRRGEPPPIRACAH